MSKLIDITGQRFGRWTALKHILGQRKWLCQCDCGNQKEVNTQNLQKGKTTSCGCYNRETASSRGHDLTGMRCGHWTVLARDTKSERGGRHWHWHCRCVCGKEKSVSGSNLKSGGSTNCGCKKIQTLSWNQRKRMGPQALRSIYIYCHPQKRDYYKIGIAVKPKYRTAACYGNLILLDSFQGPNYEIARLEKQILSETSNLAECPEDMKQYAGVSEWRKGEEAVRVWHEEVTEYAQANN